MDSADDLPIEDIHPKRQKIEVDGWARLVPTGPSLTAVLRALGVRGLRVDQWYNVDVPEDSGGRVHALILMYKWRVDRGDTYKWNQSCTVATDTQTSGGGPGDVMFVNQLVNSGAVSQAVVGALLNLYGGVDGLGEDVRELHDFVESLPPIVRGAAVCSAAAVRKAHNLAAELFPAPPPPSTAAVGSAGEKDKEAELSDGFWLYSIYAPGKGRKWVYELDGCAQGAELLGCSEDSDDEESEEDGSNGWVEVVTDTLEGRVKEMRQYRIPFELYALVDDVAPLKMDNASGASEKVAGDGGEREATRDESDGCMGNAERSGDSLAVHSHGGKKVENGASRIGKIAQERHLSTHNFDPFFVEMLKLMASKGQLIDLIRGADEGEEEDEEERNGDGGSDRQDDEKGESVGQDQSGRLNNGNAADLTDRIPRMSARDAPRGRNDGGETSSSDV